MSSCNRSSDCGSSPFTLLIMMRSFGPWNTYCDFGKGLGALTLTLGVGVCVSVALDEI